MHIFHRLLKNMGYKWKKNNRKILYFDKNLIINWKMKYLKTMHYYRMQHKSIIFFDKTWIDNNLINKNVL